MLELILVLSVAAAVGLLYGLWGFFLAVMMLKAALEAGRLTTIAAFLGRPILFVGYLLDFVVNAVIMTVLFLELPHEWLVSPRVSRHMASPGWRGKFANWIAEELINCIAPGHCK